MNQRFVSDEILVKNFCFLVDSYRVIGQINDMVVFNKFDEMKNILKNLLIKLRTKIFFRFFVFENRPL